MKLGLVFRNPLRDGIRLYIERDVTLRKLAWFELELTRTIGVVGNMNEKMHNHAQIYPKSILNKMSIWQGMILTWT